MRYSLNRIAFFQNEENRIRLVRILIIVFPVSFILLLELLRRTVLAGSEPSVWTDLLFFFMVLLGTFLMLGLTLIFTRRLNQNIVRRNRELSILNEIIAPINETLSLGKLINTTIKKVIKLTSADAGELFLFDEKTRVQNRSYHGGEKFKGEVDLTPNPDIIRELKAAQVPLIYEDTSLVENSYADSLGAMGCGSMSLIPLRARSGFIGVLVLLSRKANHFNVNDKGLFTDIGNKLGIAIDNIRLYEKMQAVAIAEERERISKELHDGLAQVLGYVITKSQATRQILKKVVDASDNLVELENVAQDVYTDTREDILGLRTVISSERDLVTSIREYLTLYSQMHGIKTDFETGDSAIPYISQRVELQAIRIMQEALSNIRKHAEATLATVKLNADKNNITLVVKDDGKGFDVESLGKQSVSKFGLRTLRERAESIHGNLNIESRLEHGTTVTLTIPIKPNITGEDEEQK